MKRFIMISFLVVMPSIGFSQTGAAKKVEEGDWVTVSKKNHTFDEISLEGKMQAPEGSLLQGRRDQDKNQMVNLRKDFKRQLTNSRAGVRAVKP